MLAKKTTQHNPNTKKLCGPSFVDRLVSQPCSPRVQPDT